MAAKKTRPSNATGTPNSMDCGLVVTSWQLNVELTGQLSVVLPV